MWTTGNRSRYDRSTLPYPIEQWGHITSTSLSYTALSTRRARARCRTVDADIWGLTRPRKRAAGQDQGRRLAGAEQQGCLV